MKKISVSQSAFFIPRVLRSSISHAPWRRGISRSLVGASTLVFLLLAAATALGCSTTWNLNPTTDNWGTANNWTLNTVPNGFFARGNQALPLGTIFIAIDNRSAQPIAGNFSNLPDGSTFTVNNNTFQASYEGGDGNDLTLIVAP
jgi:hypothetical protein